MKYGNDDQAGQTELEQARQSMQRRMQLALKSKRELVQIYERMQRDRGAVSVEGGPVSKHDLVDAIECDERMARLQAHHAERYGAGHERCPSNNFVFLCDVSRETEGESQ